MRILRPSGATMVPRLVTVAIGLWLVVAPAILDHSERAGDSDRSAGPLVAGLSFLALWELGRSLRWLLVPLGGWLVVAPLVLWYDEPAVTANSIVCGLVTVALAPPSRPVSGAFGGGWRAVLHPVR